MAKEYELNTIRSLDELLSFEPYNNGNVGVFFDTNILIPHFNTRSNPSSLSEFVTEACNLVGRSNIIIPKIVYAELKRNEDLYLGDDRLIKKIQNMHQSGNGKRERIENDGLNILGYVNSVRRYCQKAHSNGNDEQIVAEALYHSINTQSVICSYDPDIGELLYNFHARRFADVMLKVLREVTFNGENERTMLNISSIKPKASFKFFITEYATTIKKNADTVSITSYINNKIFIQIDNNLTKKNSQS